MSLLRSRLIRKRIQKGHVLLSDSSTPRGGLLPSVIRLIGLVARCCINAVYSGVPLIWATGITVPSLYLIDTVLDAKLLLAWPILRSQRSGSDDIPVADFQSESDAWSSDSFLQRTFPAFWEGTHKNRLIVFRRRHCVISCGKQPEAEQTYSIQNQTHLS